MSLNLENGSEEGGFYFGENGKEMGHCFSGMLGNGVLLKC